MNHAGDPPEPEDAGLGALFENELDLFQEQYGSIHRRGRSLTSAQEPYELPQSLLPHTKQISRVRRFGKGQLVGYFCFSILFLALLTILVGFLVIDQSSPEEANTNQVSTDACLVGGIDDRECRAQLTLLGGNVGIATSLQREIFDYVFLIIGLTLVVLAFGLIRGLRELRKRKLIEALPGDCIDLWQLTAGKNTQVKTSSKNKSIHALRSHPVCFNTPMLLSIRDEFQRVVVLQRLCKELPKRLRQIPGDEGWGRNEDGSCYHYQSTVSLSFKSLEDFARKYDSSLAIGKKESVRAYVDRIKRRCTGIDPTVCDNYVRVYEEAKFGNGDGFTEENYLSFRRNFAEILKFFIRQRNS